jgi:aldehyde dehydrogenase (NAD+)
VNDGVHQNYIAGAWAEAAEPRPILTPRTFPMWSGEYARANETQVRAAIAAARAAFPAWSRGGVQARADMLDRIGNEILARKDELGVLLSREEGKTRPEGVGEAMRAGYLFKFFAGEVVRQAGEVLPSVRPGHQGGDHARARRRGRHHHALEFPDRDPGVEDRSCARLRQLRGVQARRPRAGLRLGARRDHRARRRARGRVQPGDGPRPRSRAGARRTSGVDAISFTGSARSAQVAQNCARALAKVQLEMGGKNPQVVLDDADLDTAVERVAAERVLLHRAALHGVEPAHRHAGHPRPLRRALVESMES